MTDKREPWRIGDNVTRHPGPKPAKPRYLPEGIGKLDAMNGIGIGRERADDKRKR